MLLKKPTRNDFSKTEKMIKDHISKTKKQRNTVTKFKPLKIIET